MKRLVSKMGVAAVLVTVMSLLSTNTAYAAAVGVITGSGTTSPGVPTDPNNPTASNNNTVAFSGTATGVFGTTAGSCTINFNGAGSDTALTGSGGGTASCNGAGITVSATLTYTRVGITVIIAGNATVNGGGACVLVGAFVFIPGQTPPANVTSYTLVGVAACVP